ncbi:MAG TPA: penicillin-binding protein 2 [Gaiellaceae bacterium]|nr:penicillin-binding protein 2 [Gaiellaceae bacterium]
MNERSSNTRVRVLVLVFALAFAAILARALWLQVVKAPGFEAMAARQHRETIAIPAGRGTIYDRTGVPLAIGEQATTVFADPRSVTSAQRVAVAAGRTLGVSADDLYPHLRDRTSRFVYVQRKADPLRAATLADLKLPGVGFYPEELRAYPQGSVAAQVLGFAGVDNDGLEGLERSLDTTLAGRPGSQVVITDPYGRAIDVVEARPERPGKNVTLTIDHQIQASAEEVLARTVRSWNARGATAIVLDPRTGAVLAMANYPSFDVNRFATAQPDARRNRAVTDLYEPGSTFKIVTIAAALEDRVVKPTTSFWLPPTIQVADRVIHEAHDRGTERMSVRQILYESSNVGTITIAEKLGAGELAAWIDRFGFGARTGIDFPGESPGMVLPLEKWSGSTIGTVPIGQGIAVTPLQMASAYAAIGNGGVRMRPHLVEKVSGKRVPVGSGKRIVSRGTADRMMGMFRDVVVEGTGTEAAIPGYTVAGKTGTASKPENGRYVSKYVASFVGLVPAEKPRLAILVAVDEPKGQIWGGVVAAPAFRDIARFALQYLEIPPDAPETNASATEAVAGGANQ